MRNIEQEQLLFLLAPTLQQTRTDQTTSRFHPLKSEISRYWLLPKLVGKTSKTSFPSNCRLPFKKRSMLKPGFHIIVSDVRSVSVTEFFERHEAKPTASLASRVLFQLPKCIHNSVDAQPNHGTFLLENCHCHFIQYL